MGTGSNKDQNINAIKVVNISNDLHENTVVSAYEMSKRYTNLIDGNPVGILDDVIESHLKLNARRKLAWILKSNASREISLSVRDFVEIFQRTNKRETRSQPEHILSINSKGRYVIVTGKKGAKNTLAIEYVKNQ